MTRFLSGYNHTEMVFIVYSQIDSNSIGEKLGMPEYSYFFVLRGFLPVLRELGRVVSVSHPEQEVDAVYDECRNRGEDCLFISFSPPNKAPIGLRCPTCCVLAWEFDRIPDEVWDDDRRNDWRFVFADHGRAITLSEYSADAVRKGMGERFSVAAIPVPVWDAFGGYRDRHFAENRPEANTKISLRGNIVDSRRYAIAPDAFALKEPVDGFDLQVWNGERLAFGFTETDEYSAYLGGFYQPEAWGTWSRIEAPWILLPRWLAGTVHLEIAACGYGYNAGREICVALGDEKKTFRLKDFSETINLSFRLDRPDCLLKFSGLNLSPVPNAEDPRSMGIGLRSVVISGDAHNTAPGEPKETERTPRAVKFEGVVYTSVFNPGDDRKNWTDMVKGFCMAFHDNPDVTLVLKMTHRSLASFLGKLHFLLQQMWPFKCRIVALHGYLEDSQYEKLIAATHFYVNTSRCEGLCLPLMEFMSCGKPAIAPCNTSLTDFVDPSCTLLVPSGIEPSIWPHDPRQVFRALKYRIDWEALVNAYRQSYAIISSQPDVYQAMGKAACSRMKAYASNHVVQEKLHHFLKTSMEREGCS